MTYHKIAESLGLDQKGDIAAAKLLDSFIDSSPKLNFLENKATIICGAGPSLKKDLEKIKKTKNITFIAADGATEALLEKNIIPDIIVSDLDGNWDAIKKAYDKGSILVIHAHSDNIDKMKKYLPEIKRFIGTTQTPAFSKLYNFGGFTDGDRAAYLAEHFNAKPIGLMGMDFGEIIGEYSGSIDAQFTIKKLSIII